MLIAFTGVAQSGKSTSANYLVEKYGFNKHGFAAGVKKAVYALNPIIHGSIMSGDENRIQDLVEEMGENFCKTHYPEYRALLQRMGTEVGRGLFGENFWVDRLFSELNNKYSSYTNGLDSLAIMGNVVIDDLRFPNEALAVRNYSGLIIQVDRGTKPLNEHSSEIPLPLNLTDGTIQNLGSVEVLHQTIDEMLDFIGFKK